MENDVIKVPIHLMMTLTVKEAAECCGFHDLSYFSKVFKEVKGYPPSAVKKTISQV